MNEIALFHSALGVRPGITEAATRLRSAGHAVHVIDQYGGRVFDDYTEAAEFVESVGFPTLMERALAGCTKLADGFISIGFSNGAGMAEYVATQRRVAGLVMLSGGLPLEMLGASAWSGDVNAQMHNSTRDPFRRQDWIDSLSAQIHAAGAALQTFDYDGGGHLFTDPSRPDEYLPDATEKLYERVLRFCAKPRSARQP